MQSLEYAGQPTSLVMRVSFARWLPDRSSRVIIQIIHIKMTNTRPRLHIQRRLIRSLRGCHLTRYHGSPRKGPSVMGTCNVVSVQTNGHRWRSSESIEFRRNRIKVHWRKPVAVNNDLGLAYPESIGVCGIVLFEATSTVSKRSREFKESVDLKHSRLSLVVDKSPHIRFRRQLRAQYLVRATHVHLALPRLFARCKSFQTVPSVLSVYFLHVAVQQEPKGARH